MYERDYLMRLILGYFQTVLVVVRRSDKEKDPEGAADLLERAISDATEIDSDVLLSLEPDSIASILQVSGTDPKLVGYVAHGLLLESRYLMMAGDLARAELRERQARALADAYGVYLPDDPADSERILQEAAEQGLFDEGSGDGESSGADAAARAFIEGARDTFATAHYEDDDASARFDPDAPLMQPELREAGSFGWEGDGGAGWGSHRA